MLVAYGRFRRLPLPLEQVSVIGWGQFILTVEEGWPIALVGPVAILPRPAAIDGPTHGSAVYGSPVSFDSECGDTGFY